MPNEIIYTRTMPPTIQEVKIYFSQKDVPELEANHFFLFYEKKLWRDKKGKLLKSWKNLAWKWINSFMITHKWVFQREIR